MLSKKDLRRAPNRDSADSRGHFLEAAMMGRQTGDQARLFYEFRLEARIPKDHLLRRINVLIGPVLDGVREHLKPY
jgi:hypothetical protein